MPVLVHAQRGCCSWHGGVAGCSSSGRTICADGTLSKSCTCTPTIVYGCTDSNSLNYNPNANRNDGSCIKKVLGCTNPNSINYNSSANLDDGSCIKKILGCTDRDSINFNETANTDDGSCIKKILGCMNSDAINYNREANIEDHSCQFQRTITKKVTIPYTKEIQSNPSIPNDSQKILRDGKDGEKTIVMEEILDEEGVVLSEKIISEEISVEPVLELVEIGTKKSFWIYYYFLFLFLICLYNRKQENTNLLISKVILQKGFKKILLLIIYASLFFPLFIDIFSICKTLCLSKKSKV